MARMLFSVAMLAIVSGPVLADFAMTGFSGTWEQELAYGSNGADTQKFEALIEPEWNFEFDDALELTAIGRLRLDFADDPGADTSRPDNYSGINGPWARSAHGEISLREFYLDAEWFGSYWRFGKHAGGEHRDDQKTADGR